MREATAAVRGTISIRANELTLRDPAVFGPGQQHNARQFARRALALAEVRSVTIQPDTGGASITYRASLAERQNVLVRLANAIGAQTNALEDAAIPPWPEGEAVTLSRVGDLITLLRLIEAKPGELRVAHAMLGAKGGAAGRRVERALRCLPGVVEATVSGHGTLRVRFDPARITSAEIVRAIEIELSGSGLPKVPGPVPVPFGIANTTVGLGTVGELMLPLATPVAAGILVATNLNVLRDAAVDLSRGKVGVPLFHTALLACSIVTGQILAYALTDWSLRYWQQRGRKKLTEEAQQLLEETLPLPEHARIVAADGGETAVPTAFLRPGDHVHVKPGETLAVDGRIVSGEALVDETTLNGARTPVRKTVGDTVLAGSWLLVGQLTVEAEQAGTATVAARIAGTVARLATVFPRERVLQRKSEHLAERTVLPTLATASVGWVAGDLITVGAILHQDWISGPVLAVPLLTLKHLRSALHSGALVQNGTAIQRIAECDFVVLDGDDPMLAASGLELAEIQSRLPDADTVLRHAAGAGLFLGDERSLSLANACRERGLIVRQPTLLTLERGCVQVRSGEHVIRLTDKPAQAFRRAPELLMEIDGHKVARLSFRPGHRPRAADAVQRLRAAGVQTFVISSGPEDKAAELACRLGADLSGGELDADGKRRFLQALRRRGVRPIYVGNLAEQPELTSEAHAAVAVGGLNGQGTVGDVVLLGHSYEGLADLVELSRRYEPGVVAATRMATIPNLLCVAGAFAGVLNGITAGIIANLGVLKVDRSVRQSLRETERPHRSRGLMTLG